MQKAEIERVVTNVRAAEQSYKSAVTQRNQAIHALAKVHGYSLTEISRTVRMTAPSIARILKQR